MDQGTFVFVGFYSDISEYIKILLLLQTNAKVTKKNVLDMLRPQLLRDDQKQKDSEKEMTSELLRNKRKKEKFQCPRQVPGLTTSP